MQPSALSSPRRLWGIFFSFGAIQAAQILLPLLALPWLARVLEPHAFGLLMYMSVLMVLTGQIMDWGFTLGAVREAAQGRENTTFLRQLLGDVLLAKALLAMCCVLAAALFLPVLPHAASYPAAFGLAVGAGMVRGLNPTWYFQGLGTGMKRMACWDVGGSALVLGLTLAVVQEPAHWPRYLALLALCKGSTYLWLWAGLWRHYKGLPLGLVNAYKALRRTWELFASVLCTVVYYHSTQLALGYFLSPRHLGMLMAADKVARAVVSLSAPVTQTLFPEICALSGTTVGNTALLLRRSLFGTALAMSVAAVGVALTAPWLLRLALGPGYDEAVPLLRILTWLIPILACNFVLGTQTLVAFGQEGLLLRVQVITACVSLPLVAALAHWGGAQGAAALSPLLELGIMSGYTWGILRLCPQAFGVSPRSTKEFLP